MNTKALALSAVTLLVGSSALAHHSHNMYDFEKEVTLNGVVKKFEWTNPHSRLFILVEDDNGRQVEWALETSSPSRLVSRGWRPNDLVPGDEVTVNFNPLRSGEPRGSLKTVTFADGTVVARGKEFDE